MTQAATKAFASQSDLTDKTITFEQLSAHCWAYTAEGDPNSGVVIGDKFILVSDATATPIMAQDLIARIRTVSDKPIKYVLLTHYHAVRVLGASAYLAEGATEVIASQGTFELIVERGAQDMQSEMERFPRLFRNAESVPGLTWPTLVVGDGTPGRQGSLTVDLGGVKVQIWHPGAGHTRGDTIAWVEEEKVLFSGDLVEYEAGVYTGDAQLEEWPATLEALRALKAEAIVPGRGEAMKGAANVNKALDYTRRWVETLYTAGKEAAAAGMDLKAAMAHARKSMDPVFGQVFIYEHCLPFDVSRAFDEARGIKNPRIWTAERDQEMWRALQG
jgi:glyoxylase-like metal-dependent hydrolase (beta-lactamase superfamily II)